MADNYHPPNIFTSNSQDFSLVASPVTHNTEQTMKNMNQDSTRPSFNVASSSHKVNLGAVDSPLDLPGSFDSSVPFVNSRVSNLGREDPTPFGLLPHKYNQKENIKGKGKEIDSKTTSFVSGSVGTVASIEAPAKNLGQTYVAHSRRVPATVVTKTKAVPKPDPDLLRSINGMYRILDLISEQGSGGLVDKVIIDQASLREFINTVSPGAYVSLTKVNFKALDVLTVKPIGVYGSKDSIVELLSYIGVVNPATARVLLSAKDGSSGPHLRSGLYLVRSVNAATTGEQLFAVYWPEDTTWNDDAMSSVRRNRITFMRYLTKIADQVVSLIAPRHAKSMVWSEESEDVTMDPEDDQTDRLFTFEVAKTNEQEEGVSARPGFTMISRNIAIDIPADNCQIDPDRFLPALLAGETAQAFMTVKYLPPSQNVQSFSKRLMNSAQLKSLLGEGNIKLSVNLNEEEISTLLEHGLRTRFPKSCHDFAIRRDDLQEKLKAFEQEEIARMKTLLEENRPMLKRSFHIAIVEKIRHKFPILHPETLGLPADITAEDHARLDDLKVMFPKLSEEFDRVIRQTDVIRPHEFKTHKEHMITARIFLAESKHLRSSDREDLVQSILEDGNLKSVLRHSKNPTPGYNTTSRLWNKVGSWINKDSSPGIAIIQEANHMTATTTDVDFMSSLDDGFTESPLLKNAREHAIDLAHNHFNAFIDRELKTLIARVQSLQGQQWKDQSTRDIFTRKAENFKDSLILLIQNMEEEVSPEMSRTVTVDSCEIDNGYYRGRDRLFRNLYTDYHVSFKESVLNDPALEYKIHVLDLTADHRQNLQLDPSFVPSPHVQERLSHTFRLPLDYRILHSQLLETGRLLLIIDDRRGNLSIYLERLSDIAGAIDRHVPRKVLHRDKIGTDCVIAFDEGKRMLSVCASTKLQLHIFVFDETYKSLQSWGTAVNLVPWYTEQTTICLSCFVCGCEEVLLIDNSGQARIFSLITQQFRPATVHLEQIPVWACSSPEGACLILSFPGDSGTSLRALHWSTFGSTLGIAIDCPGFSRDKLVLTSLVNRGSIHLMSLDTDGHLCKSLALDITQKVTEFMFKERGAKYLSKTASDVTAHNSLIDCHADVWTRFPVVPAVQRQTIVSSGGRLPKKLVFVTDRDHNKFAPRFLELVQSFEYKTRKPTGDELKNTEVVAMNFQTFVVGVESKVDWNVSWFRLGEWLVDILCLIPIQIAVTRENRFIPLKDGVTSIESEQSLLGAEVGRIVDSLSLGWYESIFQSYMASKPVKVVSSMGEQSVGKSFALNHLVDTSFAGSAMRTTEGVWMSVTPTREALIVALDFEGVHSIERSAQEDTLLVLFNTAISNLVLFRNNFALSRDITGLFQSFQSSSTVLDPAANPSLFQSRLVIIIKDVVDTDKAEIVREFSLKFQKLVQEEQGSNFISKLHAGKLDIIPWPVIESKQFYTLFPTLKKRLDQQPITHPAAGEFLHTLKTLMAKLKANDWGALSQTLAAHRAQQLLTMLPSALVLGVSDLDEPLKNIDSDTVIDMPDTTLQFYLSGSGTGNPEDREATLATLRRGWDQFDQRSSKPDDEWITELSLYLDNVSDMRVNHVREWVLSNLSRFKTSHANIETLRRAFEDATVDLKANVQLCKMECEECNLLCLRARGHAAEELHDCQTDHFCTHLCDFGDEHPEEEKECGYPAGHSGMHLCAVDIHLCGEPCNLKDKKGCSGECTKVVGHADAEHMCSARVHACGEPCQLDIVLDGNKRFSCPGTCSTPSGEDHQQHTCDHRMCPLPCQLCKRLCSNEDHLHGMVTGAVHLCGQGHSCGALCAAAGICEIDTTPQSIEATFTGRHATFQYTKYSQMAKRLPCTIPIPFGETEHTGAHSHSTDKAPFHFCETRCEGCGYFCTLPRGHAQQEHETSHGSMSKTRWAVDGPDGTVLEINGRKFGAEDDGAPMMCSLYCSEMGRHVHLDYCRAVPGTPCQDAELQHISTRLQPNPDRPKDWISHRLYWRRTGFKDPYSRDDQAKFAKCDAMCGGSEHAATATSPAQPSYCTLPTFHAPVASNQVVGLGYVSNDGHSFSCRNPVVMQQAFHVLFVIDRSGSMGCTDRRPLRNAPSADLIARYNNNRLGAVFSSLHAFWLSRQAALNAAGQQAAAARRDAYSVILFDHEIITCIANDFARSPDDLLNAVVQQQARGGTNYTQALISTQALMNQHWSSERSPVVIFLSDGECNVADETVRTFCRSAVARGKPVSFHSVSFGPRSTTLRRMTQIALEIQNSAPRDPLLPATATVDSSYAEALDSVQLAETFLGIAESLRKPRGSLMH